MICDRLWYIYYNFLTLIIKIMPVYGDRVMITIASKSSVISDTLAVYEV